MSETQEHFAVRIAFPHHLDKTGAPPTLEIVPVKFKASTKSFWGRTSEGNLFQCPGINAGQTPKQAVLASFRVWKDIDSKNQPKALSLLKAWWAAQGQLK